MKIGQVIAENRKEKGLSQRELGKLTGFPQTTISYWEMGKMKPDVEQTDKILNALDVSIVIGKHSNK